MKRKQKQLIFDAITFIVVVSCAIAGLVITTDYLAIGPDETEVEIQLHQGEIPPNATKVADAKEIEAVGEIREVFGTYDFHSCDQIFVSVSIKRKWNETKGNTKIVEFYNRGIASDRTFDYIFYKDIPPTKELGKYSVGRISSFDGKNVTVSYYEDSGILDVFGKIFLIIVITGIFGIASCLIMIVLGRVLGMEMTWPEKINKYLEEDGK